MAIDSAVSRNTYTGNGATSTYPVTFTFPEDEPESLELTVQDLDGVEYELALTTDFLVTQNTNLTGSISLVNASQTWLTAGKLKSGYTLVIRRVIEIIQETEIRNQGEFFPEVHEAVFDRLTMVDQQQQDEIDRSLKLPETETGTMVLPTLDQRANRFFYFDSNGAPAAGTTLSTQVTVSAFAEGLLDDPNATTARTTLGLGALAVKSTTATADYDNDSVTYAKIQNVSATDKVLGRSTAGAGDVEEITCTAAGRALIDDADATAQRTTLGLGTIATATSTRVLLRQVEYPLTAVSTTTTAIPGDDTVPTSTEGAQVFSQSFAASAVNTEVEVEYLIHFSHSTGTTCVAALFIGAAAAATRVVAVAPPVSALFTLRDVYSYVPGSTSSIAYSIRVGGHTGATLTVNGVAGVRQYGGVLVSRMIIREYRVT